MSLPGYGDPETWGPYDPRELRRQAAEIAKAGHSGWGNTMTDAADEIERLGDALDKIAERTGSDDPCRHLVQIARDARNQER